MTTALTDLASWLIVSDVNVRQETIVSDVRRHQGFPRLDCCCCDQCVRKAQAMCQRMTFHIQHRPVTDAFGYRDYAPAVLTDCPPEPKEFVVVAYSLYQFHVRNGRECHARAPGEGSPTPCPHPAGRSGTRVQAGVLVKRCRRAGAGRWRRGTRLRHGARPRRSTRRCTGYPVCSCPRRSQPTVGPRSRDPYAVLR